MNRQAGTSCAAIAALLLAGAGAYASDGRIKVHESTLNKLAAALGTQTLRSTVFQVDFGFFTASCVAKAHIRSVTFSIRALEIGVHASVDGEVCGVDFPGLSADTTVDVFFDAPNRRLLLSVAPKGLRVHKKFGPFHPSVTVEMSSLRIPPIPIESVPFPVQTARGLRDFTLSGRDVGLSLQDGFIELRGDVRLR